MAKEAGDNNFGDVGSVRAPAADHHQHHPLLTIEHKDYYYRKKERYEEPGSLCFSFLGNKAEEGRYWSREEM